MNGDSHDMMLGAYTMGVLDADEARQVEAHLSGCAACRDELAEFVKTRDLLGQVPPEAFLDGPPDGADLVLRRTLSDAHAERARATPRRRRTVPLAVAAAAVVGLTGLGAGVLIGHRRDHATVTVPGRTVNATYAATGAKLQATMIPADGWVRVKIRLRGVAAGTNCRIMVLAKDGTAHEAGSWRTSMSGAEVDGSALVAPRQVAAVEVQSLSGKRLVIARF
jgi:anti-sigma factor RsiW